MKGKSTMIIGFSTIFIATFMLAFIFNNIELLAERCKNGKTSEICRQLSSFTLSMLTILLIVSGFVLLICVTAYIILSL